MSFVCHISRAIVTDSAEPHITETGTFSYELLLKQILTRLEHFHNVNCY